MKLAQFLVLTAIAAISLTAQAGRYDSSEVEIVENNDGTITATGSLASARFSDNDIEQIGCRLLGKAGTVSQVHCAATDSVGTNVFCISTDSFIVEAMQAISAYSWLHIVMRGNDCERLLVSTRSYHIPDLKTQDGGKLK